MNVLYRVGDVKLCERCVIDHHLKTCDECESGSEYFYECDGKTVCEECLFKHFRKVED